MNVLTRVSWGESGRADIKLRKLKKQKWKVSLSHQRLYTVKG